MPEKRTSWRSALGAILTGALGIGVFVLALRTFPGRISAPFNLVPQGSLSGISFQSGLSQGDLSDVLGATKDTDGDGIPDAQELKVYNTSPFLEDTDSDGLTDKAEIDAGEDPNCPKGTDCRAIRLPSAREVERQELSEKLYETTVASKIAESGIPGFTDAPTIRNFLISSGLSEETVNQFSDEELLRIYREATAQQSISPPDQSLDQPSFSGLSPDEVRALLIQGGSDPEVVRGLSDQEVMRVYEQALKDIAS